MDSPASALPPPNLFRDLSRGLEDNLPRIALEKLRRTKLLVVGDLMLDRYLDGRVSRVSPEAPALVVRLLGEREVIGGAGNVACNLADFGCKAAVAGLIGADEAGRVLLALFRTAGIATAGVVRDPLRPTTTKTRVLAGSRQALRIDREETGGPAAPLQNQLLGWIEKNIARFDGVILSDYNKGCLPLGVAAKIIALAKKNKIPVLVDPKGRDYTKYRGCTAIKPNLEEAQVYTGLEAADAKGLTKAARIIAKDAACPLVAITRGAEGLALFDFRADKNGRLTQIPAIRHEVFDVTGAGDTFAAFFGLCLAANWPPDEAARLGNLAASLVVLKPGVATVSFQELLQAREQSDSSAKLRGLPELAQIVRRLREQKKKIVFTNGCFDLLHYGHIHFLEESRRRGDCLIVGLNTDRVIRRLKGAGRPCLDESQRARLIATLSCVDYIFFFDEETPLAALRELKPDVLTKGDNFASGEVVGGELVKNYGGKVARIPIEKTISTARLADQLKGQR